MLNLTPFAALTPSDLPEFLFLLKTGLTCLTCFTSCTMQFLTPDCGEQFNSLKALGQSCRTQYQTCRPASSAVCSKTLALFREAVSESMQRSSWTAQFALLSPFSTYERSRCCWLAISDRYRSAHLKVSRWCQDKNGAGRLEHPAPRHSQTLRYIVDWIFTVSTVSRSNRLCIIFQLYI